MSDVDREAIELGIASIGEFDIDKCTCDASVGFYPCHYCAEREAILAGKRVLERLAEAEEAARFYAKWYDGPAEALLGEEDRRAFMWIEENGGEP